VLHEEVEQEVVVDDDVSAANAHVRSMARSGEIGFALTDLSGKGGVTTRLLDRLTQHTPQSASRRRDHEQEITQVDDLDGSPIGEVPPSARFGGERHLPTRGHPEHA
jgi:hypothetical protein